MQLLEQRRQTTAENHCSCFPALRVQSIPTLSKYKESKALELLTRCAKNAHHINNSTFFKNGFAVSDNEKMNATLTIFSLRPTVRIRA